jgi:hypothetical protein
MAPCFISKPFANEHLFLCCWRRGAEDSRGQGFVSKDFISAFNILSISAICIFLAIHLNPRTPESLNPQAHANAFGDDPFFIKYAHLAFDTILQITYGHFTTTTTGKPTIMLILQSAAAAAARVPALEAVNSS